MVLLSSFLLVSSSAAIDDDTIIRINSRKIGLQEFQSRLSTLPRAVRLSEKEIKETLVCTLIAETILHYEALHETLDTLERVRLLLNQYFNEAVYEQWMSAEVRSRVTVTEEELLSAYVRLKECRHVAFWILPNLMDAAAVREQVTKGISPTQNPEFKDIEFAESLESVENTIYSLEDGEVSKPLFVDGSYYVFQLLKRFPHPQYSRNSFTLWKPSIEKKLRSRKEMLLVDSELDALMKGKAYSVGKHAYDFLLGQLYSTIYEKETLRFESPELIQQEIGAKEIGPGGFFNQPLITFNDGAEWTVRDFWKKLAVCPYPLDYKNPGDLKNGLLDVIKRIILFESIVKEGKSKGYGDSSYVRYQMQMWTSNLLAQALLHEYRRALFVDETDLVQYYDSTRNSYLKPERRKIIPIVVKDRGVSQRLHQEMVEGADAISLVKKYGVDGFSPDRQNPGIYITRDSWGKIGEVAFTMEAGQLSETFKNSDSTYAIVKLLEIEPAAPYPLDEIRSKLRSILEDRQLQQKVEGFLSSAVKNYVIRIDKAALKKVEYLGGNMVVKKTHFPMRSAVPGFPLFNPKAKWYQEVVGRD